MTISVLRIKDENGNWQDVPAIRGEDGITPHIGDNGNWWLGETDTGIPAAGGGSEVGTPGGYYTPTVSQVDDNTMRISFLGSQAGMDAVADQDITLPAGPQGGDGKDGTSVTVSSVSESEVSGGSNVVNFSDGKSLTVKNGKDGAKGDKGDKGDPGQDGAVGPQGPAGPAGADGQDGYTPVKGVDYFDGTDGKDGAKGDTGKSAYQSYLDTGGTLSEAEWVAEMARPIDDTLSDTSTNPVQNKVVKAKIDELSGEIDNLQLTNGMMDIVSSVSEMIDQSKRYILNDNGVGKIYEYTPNETITNLYNSSTAKVNYRISSSGAESVEKGLILTDFIPINWGTLPYIAKFSGKTFMNSLNRAYAIQITYYDESKEFLKNISLAQVNFAADENGIYSVNLSNPNSIESGSYLTTEVQNSRFLRFTLAVNDGSTSLTTDDANGIVIEFEQETEPAGFKFTGVTMVVTDQSVDILNLKNDISDHETRLDLLENSDSESGAMPDYWLSHLEEKADKIQLAMESAGRNKSAFLFYTDAHWVNNNSKKSPLIMKYLIANTPMNKVNFGGDIIGDSLLATREEMKYLYEWRRMIKDLPNHHSVLGNHDNFNSDDVDYENTNFRYAFLIAPEESHDMVMGSDFCYYIDNPCEKTRYLYLDTGRFYMTDDEGKFLVDSLIDTPTGWHVVAISHIWFVYTSTTTPTVGTIDGYAQKVLDLFDSYNARQSGTFTMQHVGCEYDFSSCGGKVEFCIGGHIHYQYILNSTGGIPIILTPSDANQVRGGDTYESGTTTEASVCGVVANYATNKVSLIFAGRGTDTEVDLS